MHTAPAEPGVSLPNEPDHEVRPVGARVVFARNVDQQVQPPGHGRGQANNQALASEHAQAFREEALKRVIESLDSALFERVTGLTVADFQLLNSIGVFNA